MSEQNGFGWKKRAVVPFECPDGAICMLRRPGPEMSLKASRIVRPLQKLQAEDGEPQKLSDFLEKMAKLDDDELLKVVTYAREMVLACVVSIQGGAKLKEKPSPGIEDEIGPEDMPEAAFWAIFNWGASGGKEMPVKVAGEDVTVESVATFSSGEEPGSAVSEYSEDISPAPI